MYSSVRATYSLEHDPSVIESAELHMMIKDYLQIAFAVAETRSFSPVVISTGKLHPLSIRANSGIVTTQEVNN